MQSKKWCVFFFLGRSQDIETYLKFVDIETYLKFVVDNFWKCRYTPVFDT